ncbi:MAG: CARDB domain-containing protein [Thermodesulfobacteriota bacterium]
MLAWCIFQAFALVPLGSAENPNRLFFFNTLSDLLRGDLWQWISQQEVVRHLYIYPERFIVVGLGTTNWPERMGEVLVSGTVDKVRFQWANPEYPYRIQDIQDGVFPWIQVAVVDPKNFLELDLERTDDLHGELVRRFRTRRVDRCALVIDAQTNQVEYSLTYRIPKSGLDLTVPGGKEAYLRAFKEVAQANWIFQGIYVDEALASGCGVPPGQPLLLMGRNTRTQNGGLIRRARIQAARVQYFPIDHHEVIKSDLTVSEVRVHEDRMTVQVKNLGGLTAEHVKLRLSFPDTKREHEAVLPRLKPEEELSVRFRVTKTPGDRTMILTVDPEDQILESDESNNRVERKQGLLGW